MTAQTQANDISELPFNEQVRLIISEQFFTMRCKAVVSESKGAGFVDCEMPNTYLRLISGNKKRIKKTVINVPVGYIDGTKLVFPDDGLHGVLLVSNYPMNEIEVERIADLSCVNVIGEKCLFIPAMYEGEFAKELEISALQKITIGMNGGTIKGVAVDGCEVTIPINQGGNQDVVTEVGGGSGSPATGTYTPKELKGTITEASDFVFVAKTKP